MASNLTLAPGQNLTQHLHHCPGSPWYSFGIGGVATSGLCTFAIFGNLICMLVLSRRSMRSSVNCILLALSCSDLINVTCCLLIRGIQRTLQHFCAGHGYTEYFQPHALPYIFPIGTIAQVCSVYFTVLVSIERFIAVCRPFKARIWCTWRRSMIFCALVTLFSALYNMPTWWELETRARIKSTGNDSIVLGYAAKKTSLYADRSYVFWYVNWGSFFVIRCIPFILLVVLNLFIYRQILRMNKLRQDMTQSQVQEVSIAKMLFCIVIIFVLCNVVTIISHMLDAFGFHRPHELTSASNFLVLINSAVNFIIYSFMSKNFRRVLINLLKTGRSSRSVKNYSGPSSHAGGGRSAVKTETYSLQSSSNVKSTYNPNRERV